MPSRRSFEGPGAAHIPFKGSQAWASYLSPVGLSTHHSKVTAQAQRRRQDSDAPGYHGQRSADHAATRWSARRDARRHRDVIEGEWAI